jgi:transcriptional regulator with XRE-family HTH domain
MLTPEEYYWARLLQELRKHLGWTQAQLANSLGVTVTTVSRWERGQVIPRPVYQEKILKLWEESTRPRGFPYYYRDHTVILELEASGQRAIVRAQKTIVVTAPILREFPWELFCDGEVGNVRVSPGHISREFKEAAKVYKVQDFEKELRAGQVLTISLEWEALDSFLSEHEWNAIEIIVPTEHCKMIVRFPKERPPKEYSITGLLLGQRLQIQNPVEKIETKEGIVELHWEIDNPEFNATYTLSWVW